MHQESVLGSLLSLVYINDLPDQINSICKIFANDSSIFSAGHDKSFSRNELNNDLWDFQWKISFNPDPNKHAQEVYFSKKSKKMIPKT